MNVIRADVRHGLCRCNVWCRQQRLSQGENERGHPIDARTDLVPGV